MKPFKLIAKIVAGLVVLALSALAILLVPHHLQIRSMDARLPSVDEIARLGQSSPENPVDVAFVNTSEQKSATGVVGHLAILVSWTDGRELMIDTGMDREAALAFGEPIELIMDAEPAEAYGPVEEQIGDRVQDVSAIVFTHLHSDHTQGVTAICEQMSQPALIFQTRAQATEHNHLTTDGQMLINESACSKTLIADEPIATLKGYPGVFAIPAAGHTPGSTVFVVVTTEQTWVFSGDITNAMSNILNNQDKGWVYSYLVVPERTTLLESWRIRLRELNEVEGITVLPAHDIDHMRSQGLNEVGRS